MRKNLGDLKRLHYKLALALGHGHSDVVQLAAEIADYATKYSRSARYECASKVRAIRGATSQRRRNLSDSAA